MKTTHAEPAAKPHTRLNWPFCLLTLGVLSVSILGGMGLLDLWRLHFGSAKEIAAILGLGVEVHLQCVIHLRSADHNYSPEEMALAVGPEYVGLVSLVERTLAKDAQVTSAHWCTFKARSFIHLVAKRQENVFSLIITQRGGESLPSDDKSIVTDVMGLPLYQTHSKGLEVAGFETQRHFVFAVSTSSPKENLQIVSELAPPVRRFLAKLER